MRNRFSFFVTLLFLILGLIWSIPFAQSQTMVFGWSEATGDLNPIKGFLVTVTDAETGNVLSTTHEKKQFKWDFQPGHLYDLTVTPYGEGGAKGLPIIETRIKVRRQQSFTID